MTPVNINPIQWNQAVGIARQSCARIFRDGGQPRDALVAFGLDASGGSTSDWSRVVEDIAQVLCRQPALKRAA